MLLAVLHSKLTGRRSFSGLATIVRIVLMYYLNIEKFLNQPEADLKIKLAEAPEPSLFDSMELGKCMVSNLSGQ